MKKLPLFTVIKLNSTLSSGPVGQTGYTESVALGGGFQTGFHLQTEGIIVDVCYEMWE